MKRSTPDSPVTTPGSTRKPAATRNFTAIAAVLLAACTGGSTAPAPAGPDGRTSAHDGPAAAAAPAAANVPAPAAPAPTVDPSVALKPSTLSTTAEADDGGATDAPLTIRFSVRVAGEGGRPPYRHVWDFGDATPAVEGGNPTHVYRLPGHFRASVMTVDADGQYDQDWVDVLVQPNYEAMGLSPEEIHKRVEAAREATRKALEAMPGGLGGPGSGAP